MSFAVDFPQPVLVSISRPGVRWSLQPDEIMVAKNVEARVADVETDQVDTLVAVQIETAGAFVCRSVILQARKIIS